MTYPGGKYPAVSGQPPQRETQYALPASMSLSRASCSLLRRRMTTLSGSASRMTARNSRPRAHFCQYGFATDALHATARKVSERINLGSRKQDSVHQDYKFESQNITIQQGCPPALADSPGRGSPPVPRRGFPMQKGGALHPASLCLSLVSVSNPQQGNGDMRRLECGLSFAASGGLQGHLTAHPSTRKVHPDYVAHVSVSKSREPRWPSTGVSL